MLKESILVNWISSLTNFLEEFDKINLKTVVNEPIVLRDLKDISKILKRPFEETERIILDKEEQLKNELLDCFTQSELTFDLKRECSFCYGIFYEDKKIGRVHLNNGTFEVFDLLIEKVYSTKQVEFVYHQPLTVEEEIENKQECLLKIGTQDLVHKIKDVDNSISELELELLNLSKRKQEFKDNLTTQKFYFLNRELKFLNEHQEEIEMGYSSWESDVKNKIKSYKAIRHFLKELETEKSDSIYYDEFDKKMKLLNILEKEIQFKER